MLRFLAPVHWDGKLNSLKLLKISKKEELKLAPLLLNSTAVKKLFSIEISN